MKILQLLVFIGMGMPLYAQGAGALRQEFAQAIASKPNPVNGEELFAQCTACHGADAGGQHLGATPRIAGQHYRVLVGQLIDFRHGKRWDFRMEPVAAERHAMPEIQDLADVAWFVSQLDRGDVRGVGDGEYLERGAAIYSARCASCHGPAAEGDDVKEIPRLGGQHAAYLARQIYDAVDGRRPPLTRSHRKRFADLEFEDVLGLTDFLSRAEWKTGTTSEQPGGVAQ